MSYENLKLYENMTIEEWKNERKKGIGGSDASVCIKDNPYKTQIELYYEKIGKYKNDLSNNPYVEWGTRLEDVIFNKFKDNNLNLDLKKHKYIFRSKKYPFMLGNVDGLIGEDGILEIKTASEYSKSKWDGVVPKNYYAQVQHYLCILDRDFAYIAVLIGGNDYREIYVKRNDEYIEKLINAEKEFWHKVKNKIEPNDIEEVDNNDFLKDVFGEKETQDKEFRKDLEPFCKQYKKVKEEIKHLKKKKKSISNKIKKDISSEEVDTGISKIKYTPVYTKDIDEDKLKELYPDVYNEVVELKLNKKKLKKFHDVMSDERVVNQRVKYSRLSIN